jgi:photosystem II stability/assembly factor-like uncharacterized protein
MNQRSVCVATIVAVFLTACTRSESGEVSAAVSGSEQAFSIEQLLHGHLLHRLHHGSHPTPPPPPAPASCGFQPFDLGLNGASSADLLFDPRQPGVVYAAAGSTVWQSLDSGNSWHEQGSLEFAGVTRLEIDPSSAGALFAATYSGVAHSADAGKTWSQISMNGLALDMVVVAPSQPLQVYAAIDIGGLFSSSDGGASWRSVAQGYPAAQTVGLSVDPRDARTLVSAVRYVDPIGGLIEDGRVARSTDGGTTWTTMLSAQGYILSLERCSANPDVLLAGTESGVAKSLDGGLSWQVLPITADNSNVFGTAISAQNCDDFYVMHGQVGPRHTTDGGQSFGPPLVDGLNEVVSGSFPGMMVIDPGDSSRLVLATHAAVHTSSNSGASWSPVTGMLELFVDALSSSPQEPGRVWMTSWGGGVWTRLSTSAAWERLPVSELPIDYATLVVADPYVSGRVFVGGTSLYQTNDLQNFENTAVEGNPTAVAFDPSDSQHIYASSQTLGIFQSHDGGATWPMSDGALTPWDTTAGTFIDARAIVFDPADPHTVYVSTNGHGVYKSVDSGASWQNILAPTGQVFCLAITPSAPSELYACSNGVQVSSDGGATWSDATAGLTTLDVHNLLFDDVESVLYATTSKGVFIKRAGQPFIGVDLDCVNGASGITISDDGTTRRLIIGAGGSVYARQL